MYLQEYIRDESGTEFPMVGFLEGKSYPTGSLKRWPNTVDERNAANCAPAFSIEVRRS